MATVHEHYSSGGWAEVVHFQAGENLVILERFLSVGAGVQTANERIYLTDEQARAVVETLAEHLGMFTAAQTAEEEA